MSNRTQPLRRAPALIVRGRASSEVDTRYRFRLPVPPVPTGGSYAAHAVERRAKKLYFAVLDAMRTGVIEPTLRGKLTRLIIEARPRPDYMLRHLMRVLDAVARRARETGGKPLLPTPPAPLEEIDVSISSPPSITSPAAAAVHDALKWPLEWLQTRGLTLAKRANVNPREVASSQPTV
jgi:hypothetical protein